MVSKAFINKIQQSTGIAGSRAKNTGKGSKFLDSVKEKSIIKESDTVELKGITAFSELPDNSITSANGIILKDNFIQNDNSIRS